MHTECWIKMAADTHKEYLHISYCCPGQQWLHQDGFRHNTPASGENRKRKYCRRNAQCGLKFNKRYWQNTNKNNTR